jgi:YHS domain-containing protein
LLSECCGQVEQSVITGERTEKSLIETNQLDIWIPPDIINYVEKRRDTPILGGFSERMTPLRLLILAILFYIGWRLLKRSFAKKQADIKREDHDLGLQDVLVEDPVCHVLVPKHQALRLRRDGITYYFCSEQCCDQFTGKPEQGEK